MLLWYGINLTFQVYLSLLLGMWYPMLQPNFPSLISENNSGTLFSSSPVPFLCILFCRNPLLHQWPYGKATACLCHLPDMIFPFFQFRAYFLHFSYVFMSPPHYNYVYTRSQIFEADREFLIFADRMLKISLNWIMRVSWKSYSMNRRWKRESGC